MTHNHTQSHTITNNHTQAHSVTHVHTIAHTTAHSHATAHELSQARPHKSNAPVFTQQHTEEHAGTHTIIHNQTQHTGSNEVHSTSSNRLVTCTRAMSRAVGKASGSGAPQPAQSSADVRRVALDGQAYTWAEYEEDRKSVV